MLEDDFYCTIKFKGGDEIFAKVAADVDDDRTMLLVSNPIVVEEVKLKAQNIVKFYDKCIRGWVKLNNEKRQIEKLF